ncbi:hypothetical protein [uncultured Erythrobacter sp.]|uniref:hypothetical protein n=1 Tax=uncultured Erythrobacter sp. TaxID=263913 RepID=UPI00262CD7FE|nr:hypothetical protein [uncultured Erythrobacter sp.]
MKGKLGFAALTMLLLATPAPAMASDFSGMIYFFVGIFLVIAAIVAAIIFIARRASSGGSAGADAVTAALLALCFAPVSSLDLLVSGDLIVWPLGLIIIFLSLGADYVDLLPFGLVSFVVTAGLVYWFLARRRLRQEGEDEA